MGAGKSSVGQEVARRLNWAFEDLDDRIQNRERRTIAEIFRNSGEQHFRQTEHHALKAIVDELKGGGTRVVALGGGAFVQPANASLLKKSGAVALFLDAPVDTLWKRCCQQQQQLGTERPLLQSQNQFRDLHQARRRSYLKASLRIDTANRSIDQIAGQIIRALKLKKIDVRTQEGELE